MPLTYTWLCYFLEKVDAIATAEDLDSAASKIAAEFKWARGVFDAMLMRRLGELYQIWCQQKKEVRTQINGYLGGIFAPYYDGVRAYPLPPSAKGLIFFE